MALGHVWFILFGTDWFKVNRESLSGTAAIKCKRRPGNLFDVCVPDIILCPYLAHVGQVGTLAPSHVKGIVESTLSLSEAL